MKSLIIGLLVLLFAVSVMLVVAEDSGYLLLSYGSWTVETSLALGVLILLLAFAGLYYLIRLSVNLRALPGWAFGWNKRRKTRRARVALLDGLTDLAAGHWEKAEKVLAKYVRYSEAPLLNYLGAARAAQQLGAQTRCDNYLHLAYQRVPSAETAVGLTQAELQLAQRRFDAALTTLTHVHDIAPRHTYALKLLMRLYSETGDWERLRTLLPDLRKSGAAGNDELDALEVQTLAATFAHEAQGGDLSALQLTWNRLPRRFRAHQELLTAYARQLTALGANAAAEPLVRDSLNAQWNDDLAYLYGVIPGSNPTRQLAYAEAWLKSQSVNPVLLLTLGRLCKRNRLWGKARSYLEASLNQAPRPETYQELGSLLEQLKDRDAAMECYRQGVLLALRQAPSRAVPAAIAARTTTARPVPALPAPAR